MGKTIRTAKSSFILREMKTFQTVRQNVSLAAGFGERNAKSVSKISTFNF
jgi:hypothetical protein